MKTTSQRERACDEESEERSEGLTVARAAKQVKKDEAKLEEALVQEMRNYPCLWNTRSYQEQQKKAVCVVLD